MGAAAIKKTEAVVVAWNPVNEEIYLVPVEGQTAGPEEKLAIGCETWEQENTGNPLQGNEAEYQVSRLAINFSTAEKIIDSKENAQLDLYIIKDTTNSERFCVVQLCPFRKHEEKARIVFFTETEKRVLFRPISKTILDDIHKLMEENTQIKLTRIVHHTSFVIASRKLGVVCPDQ